MRTHRIGFHGTSETAFNAILAEGFNAMSGRQVWTPSAGNNYFWDLNAYGWNRDGISGCFDDAANAAVPSLLFANENEVRRVIVVTDLTDLDICEDTSYGASEMALLIPGVIDPSRIITAWRDSSDLLPLRALFASAYLNDRLIDQNWRLSTLETTLAKRVQADIKLHSAVENIVGELNQSMEVAYKMKRLPRWASPFLNLSGGSELKAAA